jgi:hypothetical protein
MGGRLRQVGWRGGNTSSSEGTSSWWLPMAYITVSCQYTYTDHQQRLGERQRITKRISYLDKAAGWTHKVLLAIIFRSVFWTSE